MTYSIHSSSAVRHHPSATFSSEKCSIMNNTISLKRKSLSPFSSEPSPKRVTLNSPPSSTTIAATEDGPSISPITLPSPAFSPFSKRVSEKSPFSTTTNAAAATANATVAPPLPFSRFTKTQPNNNKSLRRTLSEPPVFDSFASFCRYMKYSQSPDNTKNNSISVKLPLRRSISDPITADINLVPAPATTKRKILKEFLNEAVDKEEDNAPDNNEENNTNNSEVPEQFTNEEDDRRVRVTILSHKSGSC